MRWRYQAGTCLLPAWQAGLTCWTSPPALWFYLPATSLLHLPATALTWTGTQGSHCLYIHHLQAGVLLLCLPTHHPTVDSGLTGTLILLIHKLSTTYISLSATTSSITSSLTVSHSTHSMPSPHTHQTEKAHWEEGEHTHCWHLHHVCVHTWEVTWHKAVALFPPEWEKGMKKERSHRWRGREELVHAACTFPPHCLPCLSSLPLTSLSHTHCTAPACLGSRLKQTTWASLSGVAPLSRLQWREAHRHAFTL